ncbi:MAG TPA: Spy/CpxP family protein refolding chaperone [Xanthobacteraceae bacterium]|jgi:hypothetical protein
MRRSAIPILYLLVLSLAVPSTVGARPRFGPAGLLGIMTAPFHRVFSHHRHSWRHHHRNVARPATPAARNENAGAERHSTKAALSPSPVFWPQASADLFEYLFFPAGPRGERFWSHGYAAMVGAAFAGPDIGEDGRSRHLASGDDATAGASAPAAARCDDGAATADALATRLAQTIAPQREGLEQLRSALAQAAARIQAACPSVAPATFAQRLKTIQDRIWAMHDALLTIRLPLEKFYGSLTEEQRQRLRHEEAGMRDHGAAPAEAPGPSCAARAAAANDDPLRAIEHAVAPAEAQRASFAAVRENSAALERLIAASCPASPLPDPMARFAAVSDRLDLMLFASMSMGPALQAVYDALDEHQKQGISRAMRQDERPAAATGDR